MSGSRLLISADIEKAKEFTTSLNIKIPEFDIIQDGGLLLGISLIFSLFIVSLVIRKMNTQ